ncbi:MAG: tetratricopeptide repeat protein [Deltaproteobacteria bacterium]|nr:tetratricopeptide repeat protein [Deltaproteobacteria bacterium]
MSKNKKHEMTKEEVRAPDKFQVWLEGVWQKLVKHKKIILIAVVAFVGVGVGLWALGLSKRSATNTAAAAQREATLPIGAAVGEKDPASTADDAGLPEPLRFPDEAARRAAVAGAIAKYLADRGGDDAVELIALTDVNVKLQAGQVAEAQAALDAWLGKYPGSAARTVALETKARIHIQKGERDQAIAALDELAKSVGGSFKADVLARLGDLHNPALAGGAGDAAKARAAYEQAMASLEGPAPPPDDSPFGPGGLRGTLQNRLELLP